MPDSVPIRLLLVEDDASIGEPVRDALALEGFALEWVTTGRDALTAHATAPDDRPFDLVLLDLGLPDLDGREVCRRLRARSDVPVIVLTARDDEVERVLLLESGADDYVLKPFSLRELVARVRAVHRRSAARDRVPHRAGAPSDEQLVVDTRARRVAVRGTPVDLTPKEFDLLALLASEPGRAFTREEILEHVWDEHWWGSTKTLDVHIASLRRKLGDEPWITTLRGVGYRLDLP